jgi:hypothetical protein
MLPILEDYMERLQALRAAIQQVLEGLPPQALNWVPVRNCFHASQCYLSITPGRVILAAPFGRPKS